MSPNQDEDILHRNKLHYRTLFNNSLDAVLFTSPDGAILNANPAACKMFGLTVEEICTAGRSGIMDTSDPRLLEAIKIRQATGKFFGELTGIRNDGTKFPVELSSAVFTDKEGNIHTSMIIRDISERKFLEASLIESQEKYKRFFEEDLTGNFVLDRHGFVLECNQSFLEIFGFVEKPEIIGQKISIIYEDLSGFEETLNQLRTYGKLTNIEVIRKRKDGELIHLVENKIARFDDTGEIIEIKGYVFDITKRIVAEEALKANEEGLRRLNATKDKFFSIIAHDLRSPFSAIVGFSDLILNQLRTNDLEGLEKYTEVIKQSSQRVMDLLSNLLEWSRTQTGHIYYKPQSKDIGALIRETVDLLNVSAKQKSIPIRVDIMPALFAYVDGDMIKSIMRNLLSNAIKFTYPEGCIVVSARQIGTELVVSVSDNGIGIGKEDIEKLFKIDESTSTSGTQNEKGTGLGLILCKEFIDKHKGKIWVDSEVGKGSTFSFSIPTV